MMAFKVIIAGCRNFSNWGFLCKKVSNILQNTTDVEIVSGRCDDSKNGVHTFTTPEGIKVYGADGLGEQYAFMNTLPVKAFPADWSTFGKSAGPKRNQQMADYADFF